MSNLVVFSFLSRGSSRQRQEILTRVMDRHFILHFSTIPGEYYPRNGLEGSHSDTLPFDTENPQSRNVYLCPQTCSLPGHVPAGDCASWSPREHPPGASRVPAAGAPSPHRSCHRQPAQAPHNSVCNHRGRSDRSSINGVG